MHIYFINMGIRYYYSVRDAKPNAGHYSLSLLQHYGHLRSIITQNVDGLHLRSGARKDATVELHGTLFVVKCRHGHEIDRDEFQEMLGRENPGWKEFVDGLEARGEQLRTNPDGDVSGLLLSGYGRQGVDSCDID
jgi:NAD+-dependent protein deacetylase sirtuin 4